MLRNQSQAHQISVYEACTVKAAELGLIIKRSPELFSVTNNADDSKMIWHNFDTVYELEGFINGILASAKLDQELIKKTAVEK